MALTIVPSARVFNGNVGTQAYVSGSTGSKCLCCPYGYHIDLDFVRYCEAVAAGSIGDRSSIERRKKRERRRQCQSMEVLLGLVSPALGGIEAESPEISRGSSSRWPDERDGGREAEDENSSNTVQKSSHDEYRRFHRPRQRREEEEEKVVSPSFDLSDVVGDFEATLKRSSESSRTRDDRQIDRTRIDGKIPTGFLA